MSLQFDTDRQRWLDPSAVEFPVACAAALGKGVHATVDPFTGDIVTLRCIAPARREQMSPALQHLVTDPRGRAIVRRLVLATALAADDLPGTEAAYALDRLHARIDLVEFAPQFELGFDDPDIETVIDAVSSGDLAVTDTNGPVLRAGLDALWRFTSAPPRRPTVARYGPDFMSHAVEEPASPAVTIRVASLAYAADLALGGVAAEARVVRSGNTVEFTLRIPFADRFAGEVDFYVVEPDADDAVVGIATPVAVDAAATSHDGTPVRVLRARLLLPHSFQPEHAELLLVPSTTVSLPSRHSRDLAVAEVRARTAVRLAQKGRALEAFDAIAQSRERLQMGKADGAVLARAKQIADAIERGEVKGERVADL